MARPSPLDLLLQTDARAYVEDVLGTEDWLTVYGPGPGPLGGEPMFSALLSPVRIEDALARTEWDLVAGDGVPGFNAAGDTPTYHRWSPRTGLEPLVVVQEFNVEVPGARGVTLVEEFRLLFNLAYVPRDEVYLDVSTGTPVTVARLRDGRMEVQRTWLRRFLAVKGMHLALFFRNAVYSAVPIAEVPGGAHDMGESRDDLTYELNVRDAAQMTYARGQTFSKLIGKKLVAPLPIEQCGVYPYESERDALSYVVGQDGQGRPVERVADPHDAAHYLDRVFFRREVLSKYYADSSRYTVSDGMVHCGTLWGLPVDNDRDDLVVVFLGDLSHLPTDEQRYWRAFNVPPDGGLSDTAFQRSMMAEFADPVEPALAFRQAHERTNKVWEAALGWPLFRPLSADDQHNLDGLRVPLNDGAAEFDGQILALAKAAIDSLNEKPIRKAAMAAGHEYEGGEQGIAKLIGYLDATEFDAREFDRSPTDWMKDIQWLRSKGSAHRKGSDYAEVAEHFGIEDRGRPAVMRDLLTEGAGLLDALAAHAKNLVAGAAPEAA